MQQVPRYVIVGNGNVAAHMCYYFECLKLDFRQWSRNESLDQLDKLLDNATHVLVLIKDSEIQNFVDRHLTNKSKKTNNNSLLWSFRYQKCLLSTSITKLPR